MAESIMKKDPKAWKLIATSSGSTHVNFTDLSTRGYVEIFIKSDASSGATIPIIALPTTAYWGGYYGSTFGSLFGVYISKTTMYGTYGQIDSGTVLSNRTWYLYAR